MEQGQDNLPPCDPDIYQNGLAVAVIAERKANEIENLVKKIAKETGVKIDWHYVGGKAEVLALGDVDKARNAFRKHTDHFLCVIESDGRWTNQYSE